jgi:hypothetical protein
MKFHRNFQIYLTPRLHLPEVHSQSKLKKFLRQHRRSSLNSLTAMKREMISLQCQLQNSASSVCNHILLSETVLRLLLPFPTTYLCEAGFSSLLVIKSKYRSRLVAEGDLRCPLAKTVPRISDLVRKKQPQPSH